MPQTTTLAKAIADGGLQPRKLDSGLQPRIPKIPSWSAHSPDVILGNVARMNELAETAKRSSAGIKQRMAVVDENNARILESLKPGVGESESPEQQMDRQRISERFKSERIRRAIDMQKTDLGIARADARREADDRAKKCAQAARYYLENPVALMTINLMRDPEKAAKVQTMLGLARSLNGEGLRLSASLALGSRDEALAAACILTTMRTKTADRQLDHHDLAKRFYRDKLIEIANAAYEVEKAQNIIYAESKAEDPLFNPSGLHKAIGLLERRHAQTIKSLTELGSQDEPEEGDEPDDETKPPEKPSQAWSGVVPDDEDED